MYIDLLSPNNYVSYNIKLAKYLGLDCAIYLAAVIKIKDNLDDNCEISYSRDQINYLTTLDIDAQKAVENNLSKLNVISNISTENDTVNVNFHEDVVINLISNTDVKTLGKIKKIVDVKSDIPVGRMTVRQKQCWELKNKIQCYNAELLYAYRDWVDGVYANPKGFLSTRSISIFQKTVDDFARGDLDLALKIIDIATVNGYRDATWAINVFNKDYAAKWKAEHSTNTNVATTPKRVEVDSEVF